MPPNSRDRAKVSDPLPPPSFYHMKRRVQGTWPKRRRACINTISVDRSKQPLPQAQVEVYPRPQIGAQPQGKKSRTQAADASKRWVYNSGVCVCVCVELYR